MKNVEDVYALSPMQEFMLLHSAHHGGGDVLFNQFCYEIDGELDARAFRSAWQTLLERHSILRTAFVWEKVKTPVQVVRRSLTLPFRSLDWSDRDSSEQARLLAALRAEDRGQHFDLTRAPLMRLVLVRLGARRHVLLWSSHHLLMDRWCLGTLFDEMHTLYRSILRGEPASLAPARAFRDYIAWVARQDAEAARRHWRETLRGFARATPLCRRVATPAAGDPAGGHLTSFDGAAYERLRARARAEGLTTGSLVYAAWALLVHAVTGSDDVVFGAAVSGRPPDLPGVESIVGSFINNLPVRVRLYTDVTPLDVARALQAQQQRHMGRDFLSPATIAACSDCDGSQPLFDNLLVWLSPTASDSDRALRLRLLPGGLDTAYPLAVAVAESEDALVFRFHPGRDHEPVEPVDRLAGRLEMMLRLVAGEDARRPLGDAPWFRGRERAPAGGEERAYRPHPATAEVTIGRGREADSAEMLAGLLNAQWQEVLGHDAFDDRTSFFEVGGNSLLAATLHARVEASLRRRLPILAMFREPTPAGMARTLLASDWPRTPEFVTPLRKGGSRLPLFGVASPEVNTLGFGLLTRHLGVEQPVYLVQAIPDRDHVRRLSPRELPGLASRYVDEIRRVQPRGPYCLLGMCTGAQLALEMTRLLETAGEQVVFLGLVNTWAYYTVSRLYSVYRFANRARYYRRRLRDLLHRPHAERMAEIRRVVGRRRAAAPVPAPGPSMPAAAPATPVARPAPDADDALVTREWLVEFGAPGNDPGLPRVAAPVTVYRLHAQPYWRVRDPTLGWGRQASRVEVELLAGDDHEAILREPFVRQLAARLGDRLAAMQAAGRSSAA